MWPWPDRRPWHDWALAGFGDSLGGVDRAAESGVLPGGGDKNMNLRARSVVTWIIVGLLAGWVASLLQGANSSGVVQWLIAGLIGSIVGGFLAQQLRIDLKTGN